MTKKEARNYFLHKRDLLSDTEIETASAQIFSQWEKSLLSNYNSFHIFLSIKEKKEIDTYPFIKYLWASHKKVYCSKVNQNSLLNYELTPETRLEKSSWGIPEPVMQEPVQLPEPDCIFVPLLAYDKQGNRVGYGKGYYDRFLLSFPNSKRIGLSFFDPVPLLEDIIPSDIPLDYIITPRYCSGFKSSTFSMEEK